MSATLLHRKRPRAPCVQQRKPLLLLLLLPCVLQAAAGASIVVGCNVGGPLGAPSQQVTFLLPPAFGSRTRIASVDAAHATSAAVTPQHYGDPQQDLFAAEAEETLHGLDEQQQQYASPWQSQQQQQQQGVWRDWRRNNNSWQRPWRPRQPWGVRTPGQEQQQQQQYGGSPSEAANAWRGQRWRQARPAAAAGAAAAGGYPWPRGMPFRVYDQQQQQQQPWLPAGAGGPFDMSADIVKSIDVGLLQQQDEQLQQQMEAVLPLSLEPDTLGDLVEGTRLQHLLRLQQDEAPAPLITSLPAAAAAAAGAANAAEAGPLGTRWFPLSASYAAALERHKAEGPEAQQRLKENLLLLQQEAGERRRRRQILDEALNRHGLHVNPASWLCRSFVYLRRTPIRNVVFALWRHKALDELYEPMQQQQQQQQQGEGGGLAGLEEDWRKHILWTTGVDLAAHPVLEKALLVRKETFFHRRFLAVARRHPSARFQYVPPRSSSSSSSSGKQRQMLLSQRPVRQRMLEGAAGGGSGGGLLEQQEEADEQQQQQQQQQQEGEEQQGLGLFADEVPQNPNAASAGGDKASRPEKGGVRRGRRVGQQEPSLETADLSLPAAPTAEDAEAHSSSSSSSSSSSMDKQEEETNMLSHAADSVGDQQLHSC